MPLRAILFDLDNTLVHRARSIASYADGFAAAFSDRLYEFDALVIADLICTHDNGGYLRTDSPFGSIKEAVSCTLASELRWKEVIEPAEIKMHWSTHFPRHAVEMPGASTLIAQLAARGLRVGIISNGAEKSRRATVDNSAFGEHMATLVSSERAGVRKPEARIFEMAAAELGVRVDECCYVGDHPRNDVIGAQRAGMRAIWLQGFHDWQEEDQPLLSVSALSEIAPLLALQ